MNVIILLLIASISVAGLFLVAVVWSVKTGQYIDEVSPAIRILFDDVPSEMSPPKETNEMVTHTIKKNV
jgi:cbb3-type cytochrome oxidase maturation protein